MDINSQTTDAHALSEEPDPRLGRCKETRSLQTAHFRFYFYSHRVRCVATSIATSAQLPHQLRVRSSSQPVVRSPHSLRASPPQVPTRERDVRASLLLSLPVESRLDDDAPWTFHEECEVCGGSGVGRGHDKRRNKTKTRTDRVGIRSCPRERCRHLTGAPSRPWMASACRGAPTPPSAPAPRFPPAALRASAAARACERRYILQHNL